MLCERRASSLVHVPQSWSEATCTTQVTQRTSWVTAHWKWATTKEEKDLYFHRWAEKFDSKLQWEYLKEPCIEHTDDPLKYWKNSQNTYPTLAVIAKRVLSVPASSASVERLVSVAGKIFRPDHYTTFECLIFIKCNKDN